jgi:hypothetical protein
MMGRVGIIRSLCFQGRAMAQAASLPPLTEDAQVQSQDSLYGKYVEQNRTGRGFFNTLLFPSQNYSTTVTHTSSYSYTDKRAQPGNLQTK